MTNTLTHEVFDDQPSELADSVPAPEADVVEQAETPVDSSATANIERPSERTRETVLGELALIRRVGSRRAASIALKERDARLEALRDPLSI